MGQIKNIKLHIVTDIKRAGQVFNGIDDGDHYRANVTLREPGEPCCISTPYFGTVRHWDLLHRLVLRLRSYFNQVHTRHLQGIVSRSLRSSLHGIWYRLLALVGWHLCVRDEVGRIALTDVGMTITLKLVFLRCDVELCVSWKCGNG